MAQKEIIRPVYIIGEVPDGLQATGCTPQNTIQGSLGTNTQLANPNGNVPPWGPAGNGEEYTAVPNQVYQGYQMQSMNPNDLAPQNQDSPQPNVQNSTASAIYNPLTDEKMQKQLYGYWARKEIDFEAKKATQQVKSQETIYQAKEKAKVKANVQMKKELMKTDISITGDGRVVISKQLFGDEAKEKSNFLVTKVEIYISDGFTEKILHATFERKNKLYDVYISTARIEKKEIFRKINPIGISFGLNENKETETMIKLFKYMVSCAQEVRLPRKNGWYYEGEKLCYAFPDELTMQEVLQYV